MFSRCFKYLPWVFLFWLHFAVGTGGADLLPGAPGANPDRQRDRETPRQERPRDEDRREGGSSRSSRSRPPLPQPRSEAVSRGEAVEIILSARGKYGETVDFLIREAPRHGTLSKMTRLRQDSVKVTYRHGGEASALNDKFTYAAQSRGSRVSAPATVDITIEEVPGQLRVPRELDFGTVISGETARRTLRVRNPAGGPVKTEVRLPEPFAFAEPGKVQPTLSLGARDEARLEILYTPQNPGAHRDPIVYTGMPGTYTMLLARAIAPIELDSRDLELRRQDSNSETGAAPDAATATAEFKLTNRSSTQQVINLTADDGLRVIPVQTLKPESTESVRVTLNNPPATGFEGEIGLSAEQFNETVSLTLPPLPPRLVVEPELLDFQRVTAGETPALALSVENTGGHDVTGLEAVVEGGFELAAGGEDAGLPGTLVPGGSHELAIKPKADQPQGRISGSVRVTAAGLEPRVVPLHARIASAPAEAARREPTRSQSAEQTTDAAPTAPAAAPAVNEPEQISATLASTRRDRERENGSMPVDAYALIPDYEPTIKELAYTVTGPTDLKISWSRPTVWERPLLQKRVLTPVDGGLDLSWEFVPVESYENGGEDLALRVTNLRPGGNYSLRLTDDEGYPLSHPFPVSMPMPDRQAGKWFGRMAFGVLAIGLVAFFYLRRNAILTWARTLGEYKP